MPLWVGLVLPLWDVSLHYGSCAQRVHSCCHLGFLFDTKCDLFAYVVLLTGVQNLLVVAVAMSFLDSVLTGNLQHILTTLYAAVLR